MQMTPVTDSSVPMSLETRALLSTHPDSRLPKPDRRPGARAAPTRLRAAAAAAAAAAPTPGPRGRPGQCAGRPASAGGPRARRRRRRLAPRPGVGWRAPRALPAARRDVTPRPAPTSVLPAGPPGTRRPARWRSIRVRRTARRRWRRRAARSWRGRRRARRSALPRLRAAFTAQAATGFGSPLQYLPTPPPPPPASRPTW